MTNLPEGARPIDGWDYEMADWVRLPAEPVVSVDLITYQHAPYIRQAIDSVLMQKTTFPFELVIGEDESTDGTRDICIEYARSHPDKVRLFLRDRRNPARSWFATPMGYNGHNTMMACRGVYVALLEGDDYWTDPLKLQKQVDVLEGDPTLSMVFTSNWRMDGDKLTLCRWVGDGGRRYTLDDLLGGNIGQTLTFMLRNVYQGDYPEWLQRCGGDWVLFVFHALYGDALCLSDATGVYRVHAGGVFSGDSRVGRCRKREKAAMLLFQHLPREIPRVKLRMMIREVRRDLVEYGLVYGMDLGAGFRAMWRLMRMGVSPFRRPSDVLRALASILPGARYSISQLKSWRRIVARDRALPCVEKKDDDQIR